MENVSNIVSIYKGLLCKDIISRLQSCGYNVSFGILNSAEFGAPQLRKRAVFIGTSTKLGQAPLPSPTYSEILYPVQHVSSHPDDFLLLRENSVY